MQFKTIKYWLFAVLASLLVACGGSGPEKVAVEYVTAMSAGDIDRYLATLHLTESEKNQMNVMKGKLATVIEAASEAANLAGGVKSIKAVNTSYGSDKKQATVDVEVTFGNGNTNVDKVNLVLTDEGWKVKPK